MNKNTLKLYAVWARVQLIEQVKQKAFEYGITADSFGEENAKTIGERALFNVEVNQRADLIREIKAKGFNQVVEEVAYTWFNRFIALRYMEVNGYLPSRVRVFTNENNAFDPEILKDSINVDLDGIDKDIVFDLIDKQDNDALYKYLLITQCNALNPLLPGMFEKISNYTELLFPNNLLRADSVIGKMISDIPEEDWTNQVQIIGWLYQYYNIELKDETFALLKKNVKISKDRIPAATQLFTPDWIVRYMVENSLGRLWYEGHSDFDKSQWKYYLDEAEQEESVKVQLEEIKAGYAKIKPEEIKIIDPCMGSGHVLVYAFDVLMQIYLSQGYSERDAAKSIVENNLYGIDIDDRAYQLAYFAVMMKARSYSRRILTKNVKYNLCTITETNSFNYDYLELFGEYKDIAKQLADEFVDAKEYGSILNIQTLLEDLKLLEEKLNEIKNTDYDNIFDNVRKAGIVTDFAPVIKQAINLAQKYDVVVTNPPYMGASNMNAKLSKFIKDNYADYKSDFFSAFMVRCSNMAKLSGYLGFLTPYVWMFIQSYEKLRHYICNSRTLETLIQFEYSAFEEATVPICTFVFQNRHIDKMGCYFRLTDFKGGMEVQRQKTLEAIANHDCGYYFEQNTSNFSKIPGSPIAYWVSDNFIKAFDNKTIGDYAEVITGMTIGDNNKYLRLWSEVNSLNVNLYKNSIDDIDLFLSNWIPYSKGGSRRNWYGNYEYVVNWKEKDHFNRSKTTLKHLYLKEALTWPFITSGDFSARLLPVGFLWDVAGSPCFINNKEFQNYILGFMGSKICNYILKIINPTINVQAIDINKLPLILDRIKNDFISVLVNENINTSKKDWDTYETSWDFKKNPLV